MAEIFLDPNKFQEQIDSYDDSVAEVKGAKYKVDQGSLKLDTITKYMECVDLYNTTLKNFAALMKLDVQAMQHVKGQWMHVDDELAAKTFVDLVVDEVTK